MHAFEVLSHPVRRRLIELLADEELSAGALTQVVRAEFGITQPAVSQHLKVLRESGFAQVRADGTRRLYAIEPEALGDVDAWLERVRRHWQPAFHALTTEVARGARRRRSEE